MKNEMTMAHRTGSSVVEGRGFDSRSVHFVPCQSSSTECDTWGRGRIRPLRELWLRGNLRRIREILRLDKPSSDQW